MFEFITISNGLAVVQHAPSGHVYRFRPKSPGLWDHLVLDSIDGSREVDRDAEYHAPAALSFAEGAAATCSVAALMLPSAALADSLRTGALRRTAAALWRR